MFDGPFCSALKNDDYTAPGVRVARLENIGHLRFRHELSSFISSEKARSLAHFSGTSSDGRRLCSRPLSTSRRASASCRMIFDGQMINKADCFCVRTLRGLCEPKLLAFRLAAPATYSALSDAVRGVTRPRIGLRDLGRLRINLPPFAEQLRIVIKVERLMARTSRVRGELARVVALGGNASGPLTLLDRLDETILAKAFRGELVPQNPNDEPAAALLDRIRALHASQAPTRRGRARAA